MIFLRVQFSDEMIVGFEIISEISKKDKNFKLEIFFHGTRLS